MALLEMADPDQVDTHLAIDTGLELEPGQFVLFNERLLHHSEVNRSNLPRCGLSIRLIPPIVRVLKYDAQNHVRPIVSGRDKMGFNQTGFIRPEDG